MVRRDRVNAWAPLTAAVAAVAFMTTGCYKPSITDGGFACAATGTRCPDGYTCAADNHCWIDPGAVNRQDGGGGGDTKPATDAGGDTAMCSMPPKALCSQGPAAGEACSPACQKGCCGRCNVVGGQAACVPAGTIKLGELCSVSADNCEAGLTCLPEVCGNGLARCYRLCNSNAECTDGAACLNTINAGNNTGRTYMTCDVPTYACDPIAGGGCPSPAFNCYVASSDRTVCDCPTRPAAQGGNNAVCSFYSQCAAGFVCITGVGDMGQAHCHFACELGKSGCPTGSHCAPMGSSVKYGYCAPDT